MSTLCVIIMMFCYDLDEQKIKQIPHNVGGSLTDDFQPCAARLKNILAMPTPNYAAFP